jgi:S-adenosylmethionine decarboxylase proenzyme
MKNALGRHLLVEFYNCDAATLDDVAGVEASMNRAAVDCGATIVQSTFHRFQPYGVSGVVVISESHLAIHTWPEFGYASVDLFTCGDTVDPLVAYEVLKKAFNAQCVEINMIQRGDLDVIRERLAAPADAAAPVADIVNNTALLQEGGVR